MQIETERLIINKFDESDIEAWALKDLCTIEDSLTLVKFVSFRRSH